MTTLVISWQDTQSKPLSKHTRSQEEEKDCAAWKFCWCHPCYSQTLGLLPKECAKEWVVRLTLWLMGHSKLGFMWFTSGPWQSRYWWLEDNGRRPTACGSPSNAGHPRRSSAKVWAVVHPLFHREKVFLEQSNYAKTRRGGLVFLNAKFPQNSLEGIEKNREMLATEEKTNTPEIIYKNHRVKIRLKYFLLNKARTLHTAFLLHILWDILF